MRILSEARVKGIFDWVYERALSGLGTMASADKLARTYLEKPGELEQKVDSLIRSQALLSGTTGFLTGLGGWIALPVTLPASLTSGLLVQTRLILAIARMAGHDPRDPQVRVLVMACLCGNAAKGVLKNLGVSLGTRITRSVVEALAAKVVWSVEKAIGKRLAVQWAQSGAKNLVKLAPLAGGVIGAGIDGFATRAVGRIAKHLFFGKPFQQPIGFRVEVNLEKVPLAEEIAERP
ncbi:MAG: EcsC family protein [Fibrobacteres bacterium]|jgi:uncharacterized protein (DUF697 family)|nr:EcsC family protein [Fibrobacterota bacterium]